MVQIFYAHEMVLDKACSGACGKLLLDAQEHLPV
jgi:hypothetical protein